MAELISVRFKRQWGQYNGGEVAGFTAAQLAAGPDGKRLIPEDAYELVEKKPTDEKPAELAPVVPVDPLAPVP